MPRARRRPRAALYHRVSTREQNPRLARAELRAAAATRGLRVVLEVEETASGRGSVRPGLARVLAAVERGAIDVVLVQRLDRWGRSTLDLLANLRRLRAAGVRFVAIAQGLEVRAEPDAVSDLTLTVLAAVADYAEPAVMQSCAAGVQVWSALRRRGGTHHPGSSSEAISASGALKRPRRSPGGRTASMASSFSDGSTRK